GNRWCLRHGGGPRRPVPSFCPGSKCHICIFLQYNIMPKFPEPRRRRTRPPPRPRFLRLVTQDRNSLMDERSGKANPERAKALAAALSQIEKQFGKGSIMRYGDNQVEHDIQVVSTGSLRSEERRVGEEGHPGGHR